MSEGLDYILSALTASLRKNTMRNPFAQQVTVSGDVAYYRFVIVFNSKDAEEELWIYMIKGRREMEDAMRKMTHEILGAEFEVRSMTPIRGSIEILMVVGTTLYAASRYKNLVESIELLKDQITRFLKSFAPPITNAEAKVDGSVILGPALANAGTGTSSLFNDDMTKTILLFYVILSHAALLAVFIWMLVKRLPVSP